MGVRASFRVWVRVRVRVGKVGKMNRMRVRVRAEVRVGKVGKMNRVWVWVRVKVWARMRVSVR